MDKKGMMTIATSSQIRRPVVLQADPESLEIDLQRMAIIVIDMQNSCVSKGGIFDMSGVDVSCNQKAIEPIRKIKNAARLKGCKVIYTLHCYSPDLRDSGGPNSPNWYKAKSLREYLENPKWREKLTIRGTWGAEIVSELKPEEDDIIVEKQRYSAFFGTNLDMILRTFNIKYLIFVGVFTNICVEATIRDAFYLDYFSVLVSDATGNLGPPLTQEATVCNVKFVYGWVTTTENILKAMQ